MRMMRCLIAAIALAGRVQQQSAAGAGWRRRSGRVGQQRRRFGPGSQQDFAATAGDRVFFAYDQPTISPEAQQILQRQAEWLQRYPNVSVTIEGHCDERGTREYNLALGERRATAVKNVLVALGIPRGAGADDQLRQGAAGRGRHPTTRPTRRTAWRHDRQLTPATGKRVSDLARAAGALFLPKTRRYA